MATISKPNTFSAGAIIVASEHNENFDTIYNDYNGGITNANISASAAIVDTKLAQITTASKVNLSALIISSQVAGDLIYASSSSALTRLPAGTSSNFLESAGTAAPAWASMVGHVLQIVSTLDGDAVTGGNILMPLDDSIPTSSEGTEFMTLAITPAATANNLKIDVVASLSNSGANGNIQTALYQDTTDAALRACTIQTGASAGNVHVISFTHTMPAATTAPTTFKVRAGGATGTTGFNANGANRVLGGVAASSIVITESKG